MGRFLFVEIRSRGVGSRPWGTVRWTAQNRRFRPSKKTPKADAESVALATIQACPAGAVIERQRPIATVRRPKSFPPFTRRLAWDVQSEHGDPRDERPATTGQR